MQFKKYIPVISLVLLTIILMIFFRYNKRDIGHFIEKGRQDLLAFYAKNLQPLFTTTEISNEDVFNFALYQSIPIDKKNNKVLTVSDVGGENLIYEIRPVQYNPGTNNYEKFVQYLGLDNEEKDKADSILSLYKKQLYISILMNDENTVAVSSKLGELQKAALADILNFARKTNYEKAWDIFPVQKSLDYNVQNYIVSAKEIPQNEFVFITPDTAFNTECIIDSKELEKAFEEISAPQVPDAPIIPKVDWGYNFKVSKPTPPSAKTADNQKNKNELAHFGSDSNFVKVVVPMPEIVISQVVNDSIRKKLDVAAEKLRNLSVSLNKKTGKNIARLEQLNKLNEKEIEFYFQDPTEFVGKTLDILTKKEFKNWDEFGKKMDSMARVFSASYSDSLLLKNKFYLDAVKKAKKAKSKSSVNYDSIK